MAISAKRLKSAAKAIGGRIGALRRAAGLTQGTLAERVGSSTAVISRVETGRELASLQRLIEIADALGCELHDLIATVATEGDAREADIAEIVAVLRARPPGTYGRPSR